MKVSIRKYAQALTESLKNEDNFQNVHDKVGNFLAILQRRKKTKLLKRFFDVFKGIWHEQNGQVGVIAVLPKEIDAAAKEKMAKDLGNVLNKRVLLNVRVEPKVLGGVRFEFDDYIIDGTLKKNLEVLKSQLAYL